MSSAVEAHVLRTLQALEVADAEVYVPFLLSYCENIDPRQQEMEAEQALSAIQQYLTDGIEDGICTSVMSDEQLAELRRLWREQAADAGPASSAQPSPPTGEGAATDVDNKVAVDTSLDSQCQAAPAEVQHQQQSPPSTSSSSDGEAEQAEERQRLRMQTLALAQRAGGGGSSSSSSARLLPVVDNHSAVLAKARAEVAAVREKRFQHKEEKRTHRQERAAEEERKRNHRLNISTARQREDAVKREAGQARVKACKDAARRRRGEER